MALAIWPVTLPQKFLAAGLSVSPAEDENLESTMEDGPPVLRAKRLFILTSIQQQIQISAVQWVILRDFWRVTCNRGSLPFQIPVWDFSGAYVNKKVWWSGAPTPAKLGKDRVLASLSIKVENFYG